MGILVTVLVALLAHSATAQTCERDLFPEFTERITRAATEYFATQLSRADDGFGTIDTELLWNVEALFRTFYAKNASTAALIGAMLDMKNASPWNGTLREISQLVRLGEFQSARKRFAGRASMELEKLGHVKSRLVCEGESDAIQVWLEQQFNSLRDAVGPELFASFLNLKLGRSLSFVMDTTGSMSGEIGAAKARVDQIINRTKGSISAPLNYVLVPYNDPGYGPVTKTGDPDEFIAELKALTASGGGDFAELAMQGLLLAAQSSSFRSIVYLFTDATAKDYQLQKQVIALCIMKKISVTFFLTNPLTKRKKRDLLQGRALYDDVAKQTGGIVLVVPKSDIESATALMEATIAPSQVQIFSAAEIVTDSISVSVDDTVQELTVLLSGDFSYESYTSPPGASVTQVPISEISGMKLFKLQGVTPGEYTFDFSGTAPFGATITALSVLGFHAVLSQKIPGTDVYVSSRQLVAGVATIAEFTIYGDIGEGYFSNFTLISRSANVLYSQALPSCESPCRTIHATASFILPSEPMLAMLTGYDENENRMQRIDPCAITPVNTRSFIEVIEDITLDPGSIISVSVRFWNMGPADVFEFRASDHLEFTSGFPSSAATTVTSGSVLEKLLSITVPTDATPGSLSKVIVTVTADGGDYFVFASFLITITDHTIRCPSLLTPTGGTLRCNNSDGLLPGTGCELTCGPEYEMQGRGYTNCLSDGSWDVVSPGECVFLGNEVCTASGDPHYNSFDGLKYDFMGSCLYIMSETKKGTDDVEPFRIAAENRVFGRNPRVSVFWNGFVTVYNTTVFLAPGGVVLVNGLKVNLPTSLERGRIQLKRVGINVVLTTNFKLEVLVDGRYLLQITLPGSYRNKVQGLCGNYNSDAADDLTINGTMFSSGSDFGNSLEIVGGSNPWCRQGEPADEGDPCANPEDRAKAQVECAYLKGECFEKCGLNDTKERAFEECVYDICADYGDIALEESIKILAQQCNAEGFEVCDWREEKDLPLPCPENSHYESEANPCANTCVDKRFSERCLDKPKQEACVCDEGFYSSGNLCVPESECGCAAEGRYYVDKEEFITAECGQRCVCSDNELQCEDYACVEETECRKAAGKYSCLPKEIDQCQATGDPHYRTFDGQSYDFMGACRYVMFDATGEDVRANRRIRVEVQNEHRGGSKRVSYVRQTTIKACNSTFTLGPNNHAEVVNMGVEKVVLDTEYTSPDGVCTLKWIGSYAVFTTTYGIKVRFGGSNFFMDAPSYYRNKVTGMCGNYTGMTELDFGGKTIAEFAELNLVPDDCAEDIGEPFVCPEDQRAVYAGMEYCGLLTDKDGPFERCHGLIDVDPFFENCVFDACATGGTDDIYFSAITSYVEACKDKGLKLCNWRDASLTPDCPEHSQWEECAPVCVSTCQDFFAESSCGSTDTIDRCVCDVGYVMKNGECIAQSGCGCTINDTYVELKTEIMEDNCLFSRTCVATNTVVRNEKPCSEEETCKLQGDQYTCVRNAYPYCQVFGDPHHITFDGRYFYIAGDCMYCLVEHQAGERGVRDAPSFRVDIINARASVPGRTRLKAVLIRIMAERTISIKLEGELVMIDDMVVTIGTGVKDVFSSTRRAGYIALDFKLGMEIHYDMKDWLRIGLDPKFMEKVQGIVGNYNGDPSDDLTYNGTLYTVESWIDLWRVADLSPKTCTVVTPPTVDPCIETGLRSRFERSCDCGVITDTDGPFAVCHAKVNPAPFFDSCVFDACSHDGSVIAIARIIEAYDRACRAEGIKPEGWRDVVQLPKECPENSRYDECASNCPPSCGGAPEEICTSACEPGCVCNEGFLLSNGKCVSADMCGCMSEETYYEHGACVSNKNCTEKSTCLNGEWDCELSTCYSNQYCGLRAGEFGCHWFDECKHDNGGCSDKCNWTNGTAVCSCPSGKVLGKDDMTCIEISNAYMMEGGGTCGQIFSMWRKEFMLWKNEYLPEWTKELESYKAIANGMMRSSGTSMCNVDWTQWFDRDDPGGCGDEETLEYILAEYPDLCCPNPVAIETRIVGASVPSVMTDVDYTASPEKGLLCENAMQKGGKRCPDFEVRFLCEQM